MTKGESEKPDQKYDAGETLGPEDSFANKPSDIDPDATIGPGQTLDPDATIGPGQTLDPDATIGPGSTGRAGASAASDPARTIAGSLAGTGFSRQPIAQRNISIPGYEILDELGRGGMGVVYKARDVSLNRIVAIKMILAGVHASDDSLARFRTEAEAVAQLQHRGIVQVFDVGQADGQPYCVLEFIDGGGLDDLMAKENLGIAESVAIVEELAHAMSSAHLAGIVHRDLKPANVLISQGGNSSTSVNVDNLGKHRPKITDFGLAKKVEQDSHQTQTGAIMGTPGYMAPEQAKGAKRIGPAADIYSLGAILFHMVADKPPFSGETPIKTIMQVINDPAPSPRSLNTNVDRDLDTIILKCLEKDPRARYASAEHLAQDLNRYQLGMPIEARPVSGIERVSKWIRRKPWAAAMIGLAALGLVGLITGGAIFNRQLSQAYQEVDEQHDIALNALDEKSKALEAESRALLAESNALAESNDARIRAETSEAQSRRRLIDNYVNNGLQAMNENRMLQALPWLSESIGMEDDPDRQTIHQLRFNLAIQNAPKPERTWLHNAMVIKCMFSDDGKQIASYTSDLRFRIHDVQANEIIYELKSPSQIVDFDINGDHQHAIIASVHIDATLGNFETANLDYQSWEVETGIVGKPFQIQVTNGDDEDLPAKISAAKNWIVWHNPENSQLEIVDAASHEVIQTFQVESDDVLFAMHPDGQYLAWRDGQELQVRKLSEPDKPILEIELKKEHLDTRFDFPLADHFGIMRDELEIYDLNDVENCRKFDPGNKGVPRIGMAADSGKLALAWSEGQLELYDENSNVIDKRRIGTAINKVFFSNDEQTLFVATRFEVKRFDTNSGDPKGSPIPSTLKPLRDAAISPDSQSLVICSGAGLFTGNGCMRVWNVSNQNAIIPLPQREPDQRTDSISAHPGGNRVAIRRVKNGAVDIFNVTNRKRPAAILSLCGNDNSVAEDQQRVKHFKWTSSDRRIVVAMADKVCMYDIPSGESVFRTEIENPGKPVVNSDSSRVAVAYGDEQELVAIIDTATGQILRDSLKHRRRVREMKFVGDSESVLATISSDLNFRTFDVESGKRLEKENIRMVPASVRFEGNNKWLCVAGERLGEQPGRVVILDIVEGKPLFEPIDMDAVATTIRVSHSSQLLAVGDINGVVRILDASNGKDRGLQFTHPGNVIEIGFSYDDRILMTVCVDGKVRVFDANSGLLLTAPFDNRGLTNQAGVDTQIESAAFLGNTYDIVQQADQTSIVPISSGNFSKQHASALSRFLCGSLISDRGTIVSVPAESLREDFSNVTIRQMMDANILRHMFK